MFRASGILLLRIPFRVPLTDLYGYDWGQAFGALFSFLFCFFFLGGEGVRVEGLFRPSGVT